MSKNRFSKKSKKMPKKMHKKTSKKAKKITKKIVKKYFGSDYGVGYKGQQSYPNGWVPYFGSKLPFVQPSNWYLPIASDKVQLQPMYTYDA